MIRSPLRPEYFKSHGMLTLGSGKLFVAPLFSLIEALALSSGLSKPVGRPSRPHAVVALLPCVRNSFHPGVPPNNDYPRSWSTSEPYYSPECMPPKCPDSVAPGGNIQKTGASGYYACVSQDPVRIEILIV